MSRAAASIVGLVLALLLCGCSFPPGVCPAIGWVSGVAIDSSAFGDEILVQVCVAGECSPAPGEDPATSTASVGVSQSDAGWSASFLSGLPDSVTIRVYELTGALISEREYDIGWTHSTEPCGGPSTAPPIVLEP